MKARIKHIFPLLSALLLMAQPSSSAAAARVDFGKDLLPVFEERCFGCHGPKKEESAMRADSREALLAGGDNGPSIIPGDSTNSILLQVLAGTHDTIATMPKKKEKLTAEQIALVRAWIDQGAVWESTAVASKRSEATNHWAFKPPARPALPSATDDSWIRTPVDNFVLARLEKESLRPSPEADKTTLLRRLCLDLTGLPPSITEADAFLADTSSNAYSAVVDRLLASPHYGERWGRHWLDAARYADSDGFEKDKQRSVWHYRDWVVDALNRDLSYDRFIIEQIAGDLLPDATQNQIVATGYLRNSMINEEGGVDPEQFRMEAMFDRMDAIGKGVLGLTIQCAQCHTHKFDPVTQEEYYRMFAFLNNSDEGSAVVYTPDQQIQRVKLLAEIRGIESDLRHCAPDWQERMSRWEDEVKTNQPEWITLDLVNSGDNAQRLYQQPDGSYLAQGYAPTKYFGKMTNTVTLPEIRAFRLETFTDPNLPANGPGRSIKGLFALSEFMVEVADATNLTNKFDVQFVGATADFSNAETPLEPLYDDRSGKKRITGPVAFALDRDETTAWGIDAGPGLRNQDRQAVFVANTNIAFPNGTFLHVRIRQLHGGWNSDDNQTLNIGRFRVSVCASSNVVADTVPKKVRDIFAIPRDRRSPAQIAAVLGHWRTTVPEWKDANDRIAALWAQHPEGQTQLVLHERDDRRMTRLLKRGDWLKPADPVEPGVPAFLNPLPSDVPPDRLAFARWLVDRQSPTTARALVNRVWQHYFGIGLVETSEDLGTQSPPPSHPELLDWLAVEFMDHGWSLKHLHRLIVNSAAYRQSSRVTPELYEKDPYNRLLARGARFRVEGEIVRDISLAASGLLNPRLGGPAVFPPAPGFLFDPPASYGPKPWAESSGPDRYRRALYTFRYRSVPHPALQTFDAPNGDYSCVRRVRSNTPLQALVSLNEPLFMEAAKALALRVLQEGGASDPDRVTYAFRRCVSRPPTDAETTEILSLLQKQTAHLSEGWIPAYDLGAVDLANPPTLPPGTTPVQLAAWTSVSRVLLNLDETITRE
jgi:mono/diheme cytochrome c family protein